MADVDRRRKLLNLVTYLLPFAKELQVEALANQSLLLKVCETYSSLPLPASFVADGTINVLALVTALYFQKKPCVIIEEPDRNIHPFLISKVVDMLKDGSANRQVVVTTHNPQLVKNADLDSIILMARDSEGFSTASRPAEKEEVKTFLKNDLGIEDLYVQDLLRI